VTENITQILLITGPAGIGKSTVCRELGIQLANKQIPHAIIESDELDRVFPRPSRDELDRLSPGTIDISSINLAAIWSTYQALGHSRLIMSGVMLHLGFDQRWIKAAIPNAEITVVRLRATESTLIERLDKREIGSGRNEQIERTLRQARRMADERPDGLVQLTVDGKTPQETAVEILKEVGWLGDLIESSASRIAGAGQ